MNKQLLAFWKSEREMLDRFYRDRMREWARGGDQGHPNRLNTRSPEFEEAYKPGGGAARRLLYTFAPQEEAEAPQVAENGQAPEQELAEA